MLEPMSDAPLQFKGLHTVISSVSIGTDSSAILEHGASLAHIIASFFCEELMTSVTAPQLGFGA